MTKGDDTVTREMQGSSKDLAETPVSTFCATLGEETVKRNQQHL